MTRVSVNPKITTSKMYHVRVEYRGIQHDLRLVRCVVFFNAARFIKRSTLTKERTMICTSKISKAEIIIIYSLLGFKFKIVILFGLIRDALLFFRVSLSFLRRFCFQENAK